MVRRTGLVPMDEEWRDVKGYEGFYQVSSFGRVKSLARKYRRTERILKGCANSTGYIQVCLSKTLYCIHRLVADAFLPNPKNYKEVNHLDWDTSNNTLDNLEWISLSGNRIHADRFPGISGHRNIKYRKNGIYEVLIQRDNDVIYNKTFPTLQDAIDARDKCLSTVE